MPYLNLRTVKGLLDYDQKRYLMDRFTDLLVETEGGGDPAFRKMVWIHIDEEEASHWQIGELRPSTELIAELVKRRSAAGPK